MVYRNSTARPNSTEFDAWPSIHTSSRTRPSSSGEMASRSSRWNAMKAHFDERFHHEKFRSPGLITCSTASLLSDATRFL
jgi:hypothetical protein